MRLVNTLLFVAVLALAGNSTVFAGKDGEKPAEEHIQKDGKSAQGGLQKGSGTCADGCRRGLHCRCRGEQKGSESCGKESCTRLNCGCRGTQKGSEKGCENCGKGSCGKPHCGCRGNCGQPCFETTTKTITRTIFETKCETLTKVVYDTVYDLKTVDDVKRVSETCYRTEEFTYQRPVYETLTKAVPYTVTWPVYETKSREVGYTQYVPSHETRMKSVPYTTFRTVTEKSYRTISYHVPRKVTYMETVRVDNGHWETRIIKCPATSDSSGKDCTCSTKPHISCERVWVPKIELRDVPRCKTVYQVCMKKVPYVHTRTIPETHTRDVPYTVTQMVPVTKTRTVYYQVCRMMSEERLKDVNYVVARMITEKGTRTVPYTKVREVPVKRTISVPREVPRTVHYTITRKVPRQVTCEVQIQVPCGCYGSGGDGKVDKPADDEDQVPTPATPAETTTAEASETPSFQLASNASVSQSNADGSEHFLTGMELYSSGQFEAAAIEFHKAVKTTPTNAKYAYFQALTLHCSGQLTEAYEALAVAVELEKQSPVKNWGRVMSRVQGNVRIWLEDGRKQLSREA